MRWAPRCTLILVTRGTDPCAGPHCGNPLICSALNTSAGAYFLRPSPLVRTLLRDPRAANEQRPLHVRHGAPPASLPPARGTMASRVAVGSARGLSVPRDSHQRSCALAPLRSRG